MPNREWRFTLPRWTCPDPQAEPRADVVRFVRAGRRRVRTIQWCRALLRVPAARSRWWVIAAQIAHALSETLSRGQLAVARGATLRRQIIHVPARLARPQRRPVLHLPQHWPWTRHWLAIWHGVFPRPSGHPRPPDPPDRRTGTTRKTDRGKAGQTSGPITPSPGGIERPVDQSSPPGNSTDPGLGVGSMSGLIGAVVVMWRGGGLRRCVGLRRLGGRVRGSAMFARR